MKVHTYTQLEAILRTAFDVDGNSIKDIAEMANLRCDSLFSISYCLTNGEQFKWPSLYKLLEKDGLIVTKQKKNGRQCWFVHPAPVASNSEEVA